MTQLERAIRGEVTPQMQEVARLEGISAETIRERVASGLVVIPFNENHQNLKACGIGYGLGTKVNANLGTSPVFPDWENEVEKMDVALAAGAHAIMDLSTGGELQECRREVLARCPVPVGTVPIYEAAVRTRLQNKPVVEMDADLLFQVIEEHAAHGVDFITVHCGVTRSIVEKLKNQPRVLGIVSRGGAMTAGWMLHRGEENPLYARFDQLLQICKRHDVTLSLGDGLRPGCLADATDRAQLEELMTLGELVQRSRAAGVQVMVEGPGHVPYDQIEANVKLQKRLCYNAPFYVLGPLVTDVAAGYDHIAGAIGGTLAAVAGADFLCYVTPSEHLGLPTAEDVREGVMASRIAAHAADIVKGVPGAWAKDLAMAEARRDLDWEKQMDLALDPQRARKVRAERNPEPQDVCSMCGEFCAIDLINKYIRIGDTPSLGLCRNE
ncbi:MAG TPA: phosphomethylpyrimidine synthase ThiC [Syntrophomonadaceae bacterium]|nr:phosphomethylpyrimidine synthase ThiC [Syntrophomonadaceae bacterium]